MSAYFIANIRIKDEDEYRLYIKDAGDVFAQFGGEYLAVDGGPEVLEGSWDYSRAVLIRFADKEELRRWYNSDAYQRILRHRLAAADCDTIIVEGK